MNRETLRAQYTAEKAEHERRTEFFVYAVYRPLSFHLTPLFLRAGASANQVSLLGLFLALLMPLAAIAPGPAYLWLAALAFSCSLLDCVDGNVARYRGSSSRLGQYIDSLGGKAYAILLALALGIVAAREVPDLGRGTWLCVSLLGGLLYVWARESRSYVKLHLGEDRDAFASRPLGVAQIAPSLPDLIPFGLILLGPLEATYVILCGLTALHAGNFGYTQARIFARLVR